MKRYFIHSYNATDKFPHKGDVYTHMYIQTHTQNVHTTLIAIAKNNSLEIQSCYQAIKHTVILLPAATKHVTILLCPVLGALSKYDRRSHLFSQGECFNYRVASSLTTSVQMSVQSSPLFVEESSSKTKQKKETKNVYIMLIVRQQNIVIRNPCIWGHPHPSFFFYLRQVMCAVITHAHYHISLTVAGICTLISNILIAAGSYILLSFATINVLWNNKQVFGMG